MIHLHGRLGYLPWQGQPAHLTRPYLTDLNDSVKIAADGIKIMSDAALDSSEDFPKARELIAKAGRVFFLGFGYHPDNMRRLGFQRGNHVGKQMFGTCYGMTSAEEQRLEEHFYQGLNLFSWTACDFLRNMSQFQTVCD